MGARLTVGPLTAAIAAALACALCPAVAHGAEINPSYVGGKVTITTKSPPGTPPASVGAKFSVFYSLISHRMIVITRSGQTIASQIGCRPVRMKGERPGGATRAAVCPDPTLYPSDHQWAIRSVEIQGTPYDDRIAIEYPRLIRTPEDPQDHRGAVCNDPDALNALLRTMQFFCSITIFGRAGDDVIWGGYNRETIYGGTGSDKIYGRQMGDDLYADGPDGQDKPGDVNFIEGGAGGDTVHAGAGDDNVILGTGSDTELGASGADEVRAREQNLTWPIGVPVFGGLPFAAKPEVDDVQCGLGATPLRVSYNSGAPDDEEAPGSGVFIRDHLFPLPNCPTIGLPGIDVTHSNQSFLPIPDYHEDPGY